MNQSLVAKKQYEGLQELLRKSKKSIQAQLPRGTRLTAEKVINTALMAAAKTPAILECDIKSIVRCVMVSAQIGLEPNGPLGTCYLVPYKNKSGQKECQFILGYRGLIELARRSENISTIEARCVYSGDEFDIEYGTESKIVHRPLGKPKPDNLTHVYAVAKLTDGSKQFEVMSREEVEAIRDRSRAGNNGPWVTDFTEMARKTVVRRMCKYLPISIELKEFLGNEQDPTAANDAVMGDVIDADYTETMTTSATPQTTK